MTDEQVKQVFASKIDSNDIRLDDQTWVSVDVFTENFASAEPTYSSMVTIDAGIKGYKPFLDACKDEGILI